MSLLAIYQVTWQSGSRAEWSSHTLRAKRGNPLVSTRQGAPPVVELISGRAIPLPREIDEIDGKSFLGKVNAKSFLGLDRLILLKYRDWFRRCRSVLVIARCANFVDRVICPRWREARLRGNCVGRLKSARAAEARSQAQHASAYRAANEHSLRTTHSSHPCRRSLAAKLALNSGRLECVQASKHLGLSPVYFRGPSVRVELPLRHRSILQRYRAAACVGSLPDLSGLARNLQATSASTREGTETALISCAWFDSPIEPHLLKTGCRAETLMITVSIRSSIVPIRKVRAVIKRTHRLKPARRIGGEMFDMFHRGAFWGEPTSLASREDSHCDWMRRADI